MTDDHERRNLLRDGVTSKKKSNQGSLRTSMKLQDRGDSDSMVTSYAPGDESAFRGRRDEGDSMLGFSRANCLVDVRSPVWNVIIVAYWGRWAENPHSGIRAECDFPRLASPRHLAHARSAFHHIIILEGRGRRRMRSRGALAAMNRPPLATLTYSLHSRQSEHGPSVAAAAW